MLMITQNFSDISYAELMRVYEESLWRKGMQNYPDRQSNEQLLLAEQDLYSYLRYILRRGAYLAAETSSGRYHSALRLEPYSDGLLITALETAPEDRGKGFANALLQAVTGFLKDKKLYAHIFADNRISRHLHEKYGFICMENSAVLLDGTVRNDVYTYILMP